jgi:metallophosphoesterase (TIGR00282 family)
MLRVLFVGDVVGQPGCQMLRRELPRLKRQYHVDLTVVNGENSAVGNGILPSSADWIFESGADVITGGNHSFQRREIYPYFEEHPQLLRPANYPSCCEGAGVYVYDLGRWRVAVISLMGTVFLEPLENPFYAIDRILAETQADCYLVDFHAEATGEKKAFAYYVDGRVSCVVGTHTHIQTADEQILENGTGYLTDLGMTGPQRSVLGVSPEDIISRYRTQMPTRFRVPEGACELDALLAEIDPQTKRCQKLTRIQIREPQKP